MASPGALLLGGLLALALVGSPLLLGSRPGAAAWPQDSAHGREAVAGRGVSAGAATSGGYATPAVNASVTFDFGTQQPVSPLLYGVFFEEIGQAGDGGLYGELVQDRSFDALATASGFLDATATRLPLSLPPQAASAGQCSGTCSCGSGLKAAKRQGCSKSCGGRASNDIILAWHALPATNTTLTKEHPLNAHNLVSMQLTAAAGPAGIWNEGYWGVPVEAGGRYGVSLHLRAPHGPPANATVSLMSGGPVLPPVVLASISCAGLGPEWRRCAGELVSSTADYQARLAVLFDGPGTLVVDSVSLFPAAAVEKGAALGLLNPWPFRADLLSALKVLQPRFLRFPGGCYVEGDWLRAAFRWKTALGPNEERPGHFNSMWGYWSTDGLGLFEYLLLAEELDAAPIWVVNNGIAHNDQVPSRDIWPWVQEALDGIEFITGPPDSPWGAVRATMGHREPWRLDYLAIGNEGCGLPWDPPNPSYQPFYSHPHLQLIANCQLGDLAPTQLWEYHVYTNPQDMWGRRHAFDGMRPESDGLVFASEFAVTEGGGQGNLIGAVSEAGFMLGMERSAVVVAAAYAPLLVNDNARPWLTNLIVFDNHRLFGIPSWHVQRMFSTHLGVSRLEATVGPTGAADTLAAGASCLSPACDRVALKLVNFSPAPLRASLALVGLPPRAALNASAELLALTSAHPLDENSFDANGRVAARTSLVGGVAERFAVTLAPWSVNVLRVQLEEPPAS